MLERENAFYMAHQAEFREKYVDKWLVIFEERLLGAFDTFKEAFTTAQEQFEGKDVLLHRPADDGVVIEIGPIVNDGKNTEGIMTVADGEPVLSVYA
jgi:hypothetical protein